MRGLIFTVFLGLPTFALADADGLARLDSIAKAYSSLSGYSDDAKVETEFEFDGKVVKRVQPLRLKFSKPNFLDLDAAFVRFVIDGKNQSIVVNSLKTIETLPAPKVFKPEMIADNAMAAGILSGPAGLPTRLILSLLTEQGAAPLLGELAMTAKNEGDREVEGNKYHVLLLDSATGADLRLLIDPTSSLIKYMDVIPADGPAENPIPGVKVAFSGQRWAAQAIKTEAIAAENFTIDNPKDFTKLLALADGPKPEKPKDAPEHKLVGKPAPDFALTVIDGPGKTKVVTKADLAGKVVILDFWATWCGPCIEEMPDIMKMIESYAADKKDVQFVALSIDDDEDARSVVEKKLAQLQLKLDSKPTGMIALDPKGKVSGSYDVEAIPYVVIIDRKGIVRNVHLGLTKRDIFEKEIDALLETK